jgi:hypothetical protein
MQSLEDRLAVLERAKRTQGRILAALGACLLALVTMGAGAGPSDVLQARRIEVIDGGGKILLSMEARDGRGVLELQNEEGQRGALLSTTPDGGALALFDERAHQVVLVGAESDGGVAELSGADGRTRVRLGSGTASGGALATYSGGGQKLVELGATADGDGTIATFDRKGEQLLALAASGRGNGRLIAYDGAKERATWPDK